MIQIAHLRLENTNPPHNKFYEMTMSCRATGSTTGWFDVVIRYGRIGTKGKEAPLKGPKLPKKGAKGISRCDAEEAFLDQLKKKFRDKSYSLVDLKINDEDLEDRIYDLQSEFEDFDRIAEMLMNRGF